MSTALTDSFESAALAHQHSPGNSFESAALGPGPWVCPLTRAPGRRPWVCPQGWHRASEALGLSTLGGSVHRVWKTIARRLSTGALSLSTGSVPGPRPWVCPQGPWVCPQGPWVCPQSTEALGLSTGKRSTRQALRGHRIPRDPGVLGMHSRIARDVVRIMSRIA